MTDVNEWDIMKQKATGPIVEAIQEEIRFWSKNGRLSDGRQI